LPDNQKELLMDSYYLYRKFMKVLSDDSIKIVFKKLPNNTCGLLNGDQVEIDHRKDDVLSVFVHELLHHIYPNTKHKDIYKMERNYMKKASWFQKKKLMQVLCIGNEK
jgi:hypothetical protein